MPDPSAINDDALSEASLVANKGADLGAHFAATPEGGCPDRQTLWPCKAGQPAVSTSGHRRPKATNCAGCPDGQSFDLLLKDNFKHHFDDIDQKLDVLTLQMSSCLDCIGAIQRFTQEWEHNANERDKCLQLLMERGLDKGFHVTGTASNALSSGMSSARAPAARRKEKLVTNASQASAASLYSMGSDVTDLEFSSRWRENIGHLPTVAEQPTMKTMPTEDAAMHMQPMVTEMVSRVRRSSMVDMLTLTKRRPDCSQMVWNFLEDPDSSTAARIYSYVWPFFISLSALTALSRSYFSVPAPVLEAGSRVDALADFLYLIELLTRWVVAPSSRRFLRSPYTIIDVWAALPLILRAALSFQVPTEETDNGTRNLAYYTFICVVPLVRLLKLLRSFQYFKLLMKVLENVTEALKFLLFIMVFLLLFFASLFYVLEPRDAVESLPQAVWFSIVTMTTVGYNPPVTGAGHAVSSLLMVLSLLYMAMPIGVLGNAFTNVWSDRDRIILIDTTRSRLDQWGYTAKDVRGLFHHYDADRNGELSITEFKNMISDMQVGIAEDRIVGLFESIDRDGGGSIDDKEFVKALFPESYHEVFATSGKKSRRSRRSHSGSSTPNKEGESGGSSARRGS